MLTASRSGIPHGEEEQHGSEDGSKEQPTEFRSRFCQDHLELRLSNLKNTTPARTHFNSHWQPPRQGGCPFVPGFVERTLLFTRLDLLFVDNPHGAAKYFLKKPFPLFPPSRVLRLCHDEHLDILKEIAWKGLL
jgi:hypothetical protein